MVDPSPYNWRHAAWRAAPLTPARRMRRLVVAGALSGVLTLAAGSAAGWLVLGPSGDGAVARLERDARRALASALAALETAADAPAVALAARSGADAAPADPAALFAATAAAPAAVAVTVYDPNGAALAWEGRPSEHGPDVLSGPTWRVVRDAAGGRLLFVRPVLLEDGSRAGTIVAESSLTEPDTAGGADGAPLLLHPSLRDALRLSLPGTAAPDFVLRAPDGTALLDAAVLPRGAAARATRWRTSVGLLAAGVAAFGLLLAAGVAVAARRHGDAAGYGRLTGLALGLLAGARAVLLVARPEGWTASPLFGRSVYAGPPWLASPFDALLTAVTMALAAAVLLDVPAAVRRARRRPATTGHGVAFLAGQLVAGAVVAVLLAVDRSLVSEAAARATADLLRFSLHPWDAGRLALQVALLAWHAALAVVIVVVLRTALLPWRLRRTPGLRFLTVAAWIGPALVGSSVVAGPALTLAWVPPLGVLAATAWRFPRLAARARRGSQALVLGLLVAAVAVPGLLAYPQTAMLTREARAALLADRYGPEALAQRATLQGQLATALDEIDAQPGLAAAFATDPPAPLAGPAFEIWRRTRLAAAPVTSSVELHDASGTLFSRYAFNLPDDLVAPPTWQEPSCDWAVFEEVSPFFADERRMLHAGRAVCDPAGAARGSIVVHAVLDYENLAFIPTANPYLEVVRPADPLLGEGRPAEGLEYAVYGWSRTPLYASAERAWLLDDGVFGRVEAARAPVWATLVRDGRAYDVYLLSDRFGIYALGLPVATSLGHLVNLAELTVLAALTVALFVIVAGAARRLIGAGLAGRALVREIRASFYRKLFLAFVAATVVPVVILALVTRTYVAGELRDGVEADALRTAAAARRVVEDLAAPRAAQQGVDVDDNLLVWVSRLIGQDVNIFAGPALVATSERNLFAGGLLSSRTPAALYQALVLERQGGAVTTDQIGDDAYLVAATPLPALPVDAMLTVPLTTQQRAIEGQIDTLDRRVLLAVLLLILGSAGVGYALAERIADPVNRLTRATRAVAGGDLGARITPTSSDELRRLMQDFNRMADELQRQRGELEQRHRLAAWAEMASQVAHEVKNPLTPIQLHAEHLRRVHDDRGRPLGDVVGDSTATILDQVTLLRRIASDFASFSASPVARPERVAMTTLLDDALASYGKGVTRRVHFTRDVPPGVPDVRADRTLVARALTNLVENALHAMPGEGTLTFRVREEPGRVAIDVIDTGVGMDADALARAFEPSFSTKLTGTGLGLPIARRNVELSHGTIAIASTAGRGTTVTVRLPRAD
jgi:two-component system nitrogen regulation sensor histidine kinase NtrY